ncbi:MAG: hypothetical protein AAGJ87_07090 [Pseudomonadota bacterium]
MKKASALKTLLLAAASTAAATTAVAVSDEAAPYETAIVEAAPVLVAEASSAEAPAPIVKPRNWLIAAFATGALAGLVRLLGGKRTINAVREAAATAAPKVARAARDAAKAPISAVKTAGAAMASPLKWAAAILGLGMLGFVGVGFYNVEWLGGLVVGAALASASAFAAWRARTALSLRPVKIRKDR